ncbi:predicted protein [Phaeodactylum tricornutum CCAP 1055/1]|uniref:Major facilitator superfamily (MFS) profile domain-containing protein n=2 Tax=Phaeodactylum tricornutum TaxID=2850 RepID=B7FPU6_PHATC|nr:predicted protein [Phaeodactylum tricornutum CCAP 1055/1]EEC51740.1 predicted protein [Phaeodactylum tricornutum CCAP 1055/1]|eukprot:XP_002177277.1 predicted protein [Phaeodactylum tricornutum CCAP 1055/1]
MKDCRLTYASGLLCLIVSSGTSFSTDCPLIPNASFHTLPSSCPTTKNNQSLRESASKMTHINNMIACSVGGGAKTRSRLPSKKQQVALRATQAVELEEGEQRQIQRRQERGMAIALSSVYFTVMGAKCALPSVLPMLLAPSTGLTFSPSWTLPPQQLMARQLTVATLAVAVGKLVLGPVIDHVGGIRSLQIALSLLAGLLALISTTQSFLVFAASWICVDFIFSSCWAGCINAIHQAFSADQWASRVGMLAAAARAGNAVAFALFASVLQYFGTRMVQPWRVVFTVSAALQVVSVALLTIFGRGVSDKASADPSEESFVPNKKPTMKDSLLVLRRESKTPEFWLHLVSRSCLMVFASFLLFVPTLMSQVYRSTPAFAAQTGSIYAVGCLLSISLGSSLYAKISKRKQAASLVALLGAAAVSSIAQLLHVAGIWTLSETAAAGFPPSLYALARGGAKSSATIADVFDIGGFGLLAAFNGYVAGIEHAVKC